MKRVVITGANKGIGRATVKAVLEADPDTFVYLGSRDRERGEAARDALVAETAGFARRISVLPLDVTSEDSVRAAAASVESPLYGVINNAGTGGTDMARVLDVNTLGPKRVCEAFLPLVQADGRIVNVASASGPMFVAGCSPEHQRRLTDKAIDWPRIAAIMDACLAIERGGGDFAAAGWGSGSAYGLSKACLIAYTMLLARENPSMTINACTPGYIETDMTRSQAVARGVSPQDLGMKPPAAGARSPVFLLLGDPGGTGWYFGSDAQRSPIDRYRSPGDPPFRGP